MKSVGMASLAAGAVLALGLVQPGAAGGLPFDLPFLAPPRFEPDWTGVHMGSQAGYSFGANIINGIDVDGDLPFGGGRTHSPQCKGGDGSEREPAPTTLGWLDDPSSPCGLRALYGFGQFGRLARITRFAPTAAEASRTGGGDLEAIEAGLFFGADRQIGRIVIGALADANALGFDPGFGSNEPVPVNTTTGAGPKLDWYATLRARAGITFQRFLGYAHGGILYAQAGGRARSEDLFGYTMGGGIEAMLTPRASARLEYQYADVTAASLADLLAGRRSGATEVDFQTVRLGLALRF